MLNLTVQADVPATQHVIPSIGNISAPGLVVSFQADQITGLTPLPIVETERRLRLASDAPVKVKERIDS